MPGKIVHIALKVKDLDSSTKFYEDVFGIYQTKTGHARGHTSRHMTDGAFDFPRLASTVRTAVRQLDRVIDLNYYPIESTRVSNMKWRPVGLGLMGLQDVFFQLRLPLLGRAVFRERLSLPAPAGHQQTRPQVQQQSQAGPGVGLRGADGTAQPALALVELTGPDQDAREPVGAAGERGRGGEGREPGDDAATSFSALAPRQARP